MKKPIIALAITLLIASYAVAAPDNGDTRKTNHSIEVWSNIEGDWINPDRFFSIELTRLNGPTYGRVSKYPPYESVEEWESLIDLLDDGRSCPMVFFHSRWRRLPDVLALDDSLRNYGGCKDVFRQ